MKDTHFESSLWNKNSDFSLAPETTEGQVQMIVLPMPVDARPEGVVNVGGTSSNGNC